MPSGSTVFARLSAPLDQVEYLGAMILSWVNTVFYRDLMAAMWGAISNGTSGGRRQKSASCGRLLLNPCPCVR
jgi:hypothetical protein